MKNLYILLISLIVLNEVNAQNWTIQNSGTASALSSVCFPASDTGYISGEGGTMLKTTNGGTNWTILTSGTSIWLYSVCFLNTKTGWTGGEDGILLKTIDGGINWHPPVLSPYFYRLNSINFPDADTGYIVGANMPSGGAVIEKSTNGNYFLPIPNGTITNWLESVYFPSVNTGYAVGDSGTIIKSTDGGLNWVVQSSGTINDLYSVYFTDPNKGYAVGDSGLILKTIDGGTNWIKKASGTLNGLKSVYFAYFNAGYIVGDNGTILTTSNSGTDWAIEFSGTVKNLHSVYFTDLITGYAAGDSGLILKTTNGGGVGIPEVPSASKPMKIYPNPTHDEITIESSSITGVTYISISNVNGLELIVKKVINNRTRIDIRDIPSGVYLIRLQNEKIVEVGKIIKE
jgi:photosystem II stability/assembly factor-like uncharacterized protein